MLIFTRADKIRITPVFLSFLPFPLLYSLVSLRSPEIVALVTSLGIIAAGYSLVWGTEALQFFVPGIRIEVTVAYMALAAVEFARTRKEIEVFRNVRDVFNRA